MTKFRISKVESDRCVFYEIDFNEFDTDDDNDWYDLFDDPSYEVCQIVVEALNKAVAEGRLKKLHEGLKP